MNFEILVSALMAALVLEKLFEAIFGPLWKKLSWDNFYKLYAAIALGSVLGFFTNLNAFPVFAIPMIGRVLTALVIGCGTSFIYDLIDRGKEIQP